jgi:drug/metabolite transporter (DMT)-like permease
MENEGLEGLWPALLAFGMLVTVVGFFFWFRLKRNWNAADREQNPKP